MEDAYGSTCYLEKPGYELRYCSSIATPPTAYILQSADLEHR
jgi:hypothetical protein